jgi:glycyl-tRNA synthetase beta chain
MSQADLLYEIGVEELPASFVEAALAALPELAANTFTELRLGHGEITALGTPRRLALVVRGVELMQPDLEETVTGPPIGAAFKDDKPTKAAEAFAAKLGITVAELARVETPKGVYIQGVKRAKGEPAAALLPAALAALTKAIPFRKSMRWGDGALAFGRPIRWLCALLGEQPLPVALEAMHSGTHSYGHRFLHPAAVAVAHPQAYVEALRGAHVLVDPEERRRVMRERLLEAAGRAGGTLIEDEFLLGENLSLVEEPHVVLGSFDTPFLALPEVVILEVARGHQRYFGVRGNDGKLLPRYLAVVNTAERPDKIAEGNDRVMRARLADARFFYDEDLSRPLAERKADLAGIVFQARLGSVLAKVERVEKLAAHLGALTAQPEEVIATAVRGAALCKCDLVTGMVGEFPELQGEMGHAYALAQGERLEVADVIRDHYKPKGARAETAASAAAALVALADRLDTLVGCFAIGLSPTGTADPFGLRRACIATLRTILERDLDLTLSEAFAAAYDGFDGVALDLERAALLEALLAFFRERLRGLFCESYATDAVDAALGVAAGRPLDARARVKAIAALEPATRAKVGEVFKRATNIAKTAPEGAPTAGQEPAEVALHGAFFAMQDELIALSRRGDYAAAFARLASLAPALDRYFQDVLVMHDDAAIRDNRLRLMRVISETCSSLARLELLGG